VSRWAVFLDRDGVLNEPVLHPESGLAESPHHPEDARLTAHCGEALRLLRGLGAVLVVVSNQPSAAKGTAAREELEAVHREVRRLVAHEDAAPDDWRYCFHHPEGVDEELGCVCDCRKPAPGLLLAAARDHDIDLAESWMIGDGDADLLAGRAAGCRTVLVEHPATSHRRGAAHTSIRAIDILAAARIVADARRGVGKNEVVTSGGA
jgi:D-glycero-D-manno-heptose 1,7-bisphosphate phosphatase